jgi:hypothetical protein
MEQSLSIWTTLGKRTSIIVDLDLRCPSPQTWVPASIGGRIHGLSISELAEIASDADAEVGFEGRPYKFGSLGKDGAFELRIVRQPAALPWGKLFTCSLSR